MITQHAIDQANHVAELLTQGHTRRQIAETLQVSKPWVCQVISQRFPDLRRDPRANDALRTWRPPLYHLELYRHQLRSIRRELLQIAGQVRTQLRELEEELEAAQIDYQLGLRR